MATNSLEERRKVFKQYKEDVKDRGKPFYPYAMLHDSIMSTVVVARDHRARGDLEVHDARATPASTRRTTDNPGQSGWLGKLLDEPADPGTISFVPRPDWYFYFLFYLLRIFKWPESVILGTIGIPTIALVLLIALPFIDLRAERHPLRRPVALIAAILAIALDGRPDLQGRDREGGARLGGARERADWAATEGFTNNPEAIAGAKLFAQVGCLNCHTYNGAGGQRTSARRI